MNLKAKVDVDSLLNDRIRFKVVKLIQSNGGYIHVMKSFFFNNNCLYL